MNPAFLLLASAALASAAVNPYVFSDLGMSIPTLEGGMYDNEDLEDLPDGFDIEASGKGKGDLCWSAGAGILVPMSESFSLDGWAAYTSAPFNAKHTFTYSIASESYNSEGEGVVDIDVTTSLVEFGGGARWAATPALGLGCGLQYSHVLSSEFDGIISISSSTLVSDDLGPQESSDSDKRKIKGDLEDLEDDLGDTTETLHVKGFDTKPQDFFSLRLAADYSITPSLALSAAYLLPLANHLEGKTLKGSLHRVTGGIRWTFGVN